MHSNFIDINSHEKLEELFLRSNQNPVLLFKHSSKCSISSDIYREIAGINAEINLIVVQTSRNISNLIAEKTGIRHQTPQAIVLKNEKSVYQASHYDITVEDLEKHLESPGRPRSPGN